MVRGTLLHSWARAVELVRLAVALGRWEATREEGAQAGEVLGVEVEGARTTFQTPAHHPPMDLASYAQACTLQRPTVPSSPLEDLEVTNTFRPSFLHHSCPPPVATKTPEVPKLSPSRITLVHQNLNPTTTCLGWTGPKRTKMKTTMTF